MFLGIFLGLGSVCCYTIFGILSQYYDLFPIDLILGRALVQALTFLLLLAVRKGPNTVSGWTILVGVLACSSNAGYITTILLLPLGPAVILSHSTVGFVAIFERMLKKTPILLEKGMCIFIMFVGEVLVVQPSFMFGHANSISALGFQEYIGIVTGLISGISNALVIVLIDFHNVPKEEVLVVGGGIGMGIGLALGPLIPGSEIFHFPNYGVLEVGMKAIIVGAFAVAAFAFQTFAVGHCPSVLLSLISTSECITSFTAQTLIFKEAANWMHFVGVGIVVTALIAATLIDNKRKEREEGYEKINEAKINP